MTLKSQWCHGAGVGQSSGCWRRRTQSGCWRRRTQSGCWRRRTQSGCWRRRTQSGKSIIFYCICFSHFNRERNHG
uniref:Uncharacterized protein n=1 Tax=Oryzias latipes TaxID=8090 RepID=A0A3P9JFS6_ORYLA